MIILKQLSNMRKIKGGGYKKNLNWVATLQGGAPTKYFLMVGSASEGMKGFLSGGRWNLQKNYEHVENFVNVITWWFSRDCVVTLVFLGIILLSISTSSQLSFDSIQSCGLLPNKVLQFHLLSQFLTHLLCSYDPSFKKRLDSPK